MSSNTGSSPGADKMHQGVHPLIETNSYTLREAAEACGVSVDTIKRRRKDGEFPSASQVDRAWRIPSAELAKVATEAGWSLTLSDAVAPVHAPGNTSGNALVDAPRQAPVRAQVQIVELEAAAAHREELHSAEMARTLDDLQRITNERDRARSDLEHERTRLDALAAETEKERAARHTAEVNTARAEGEAEALRGHVSDLTEDRDRLSADLTETRETASQKTESLEGAIIDLRDDRERAVAALGRWSRRRYEKTLD
jgi:hypothetical protein